MDLSNPQNQIATTNYYIISHGKNGKGSYTRSGTANPMNCVTDPSAAPQETTTTSELGNCNFDVDDTFIFSQWNSVASTYYDDLTIGGF